MDKRTIGSSGIRIAPIAIGGWLTFGDGVDEARAHRVLAHALDAGVDFIDLADVYGMGEAERVVGRFLRTRRREDVIVSSKVFWPTSDDPADRGLGRSHVVRSIERSLNNLGTDHLDLYFCHREDPETPLEATVAVMSELVTAGRIRAWGTSCWRAATLERAHAIAAREAGLVPPVVEQPQFNLMHRWVERDVVPAAQRLGMGVVAWSPLAGGVLTGKYLRGRPSGSRGAGTRWLDEDLGPAQTERVRRFVGLAERLSTPPAVLALAWVVSRPGITAAIMGATSEKQVTTNLRAATFVVTPDVEAELDRIFPAERGPRLLRWLRRLFG